ncbi:MAG: hypothetical protein HC804_07855 [Anaerolineae bacterium]|nr:hypothetical protein [Anaerolineae bacterium]
MSYVNEMEDCGAVYLVDGVAQDPFTLFAEQGTNLVRARLWHNPTWTEYSTLDRRAENLPAGQGGRHVYTALHSLFG